MDGLGNWGIGTVYLFVWYKGVCRYGDGSGAGHQGIVANQLETGLGLALEFWIMSNE